MGYYLHVLSFLDALVILLSFTFQVLVLRGLDSEIAGLVIVLRLWRIVSVVEGSIEASVELKEEEVERLREELEGLKGVLERERGERAGMGMGREVGMGTAMEDGEPGDTYEVEDGPRG